MPGEFDHVLWLGGTPAAGKTVVAERLAERHNLSVYHRDQHVAAHAAQAVAAGHPLSMQRDALSPEDRWVRQTAPENVMQGIAVAQELFPLLIEDVQALPTDHPVLVEGIGFYPAQVYPYLTNPRQAVWLIADAIFAETVWTVRRDAGRIPALETTSSPQIAWQHILERNAILGRYIRRQAGSLGLTTLTVDTSQELKRIVSRVEAHFDVLLA